MIDLYFWPTPNGKKVTILLEELGVEYKIIPVNIGAGDQFTDDFLKINPNHRMPALVDNKPTGGGAPVSVFESGAIMMYLAEKYGKFWPQDIPTKYKVTEWLIWQMANQGPKLGEFGHFHRLTPDQGDQTYALRRFSDEAHRLYGVLNNRLYKNKYLTGDEYTIADMISYPWTASHEFHKIDLGEFKYFKRWFDELSARPGVQRGMEAGKGMSQPQTDLSDEEKARRRALLYNQRAIPVKD